MTTTLPTAVFCGRSMGGSGSKTGWLSLKSVTVTLAEACDMRPLEVSVAKITSLYESRVSKSRLPISISSPVLSILKMFVLPAPIENATGKLLWLSALTFRTVVPVGLFSATSPVYSDWVNTGGGGGVTQARVVTVLLKEVKEL